MDIYIYNIYIYILYIIYIYIYAISAWIATQTLGSSLPADQAEDQSLFVPQIAERSPEI